MSAGTGGSPRAARRRRRACAYCGGKVPRGRWLYCGDLCCARAANGRHGDKLAAQRQAARATPRPCEACGKPFKLGALGRPSKRCLTCRNDWRRWQRCNQERRRKAKLREVPRAAE